MTRDGMQRSWVLQFETSVASPLPEPIEQCVASWGTHDLPRFAAFWEGDDIEDLLARAEIDADDAQSRRVERARWRASLLAAGAPGGPGPGARSSDGAEAGDLDARGRALRSVLRHLAASPARLVLVDLEDLWSERRPQNRPGTGLEAANWRRRSARTLTEVAGDPHVKALLDEVERLRGDAPGMLVASGQPQGWPGRGSG